MRHPSSHRNILWTGLFSVLVSLFLAACGDVSNVESSAAPPSGPLTILTADPLPAGTANADYNVTLTPNGGTPPYTWSLAPGSPTLPDGLALIPSNGKILGVPVTATATRLTEFALKDSTGQSVHKVLAITINAAPTPLTILTSSPLPSGSINQPYASALSGTGGITPYTWGLKAGSPPLPSGLSLDHSGVLSGTPTVTSDATHTVTLTDATALTVEKSLQLSIKALPLSITGPSSLPAGTVNQPYPNTQLLATGGTLPYSWSVNPALPNGLTLNPSSGVISGIPLSGSEGDSTHVFTVTDSTIPIPQQATRTQDLTIHGNVTPLIVKTKSLPDGRVGQPYSDTLQASGGTVPYTWSVTPALSAGLVLDPATGVISGTPTVKSKSDHDFTVQDSTNQTTIKKLNLEIK